jgi:hypothetical protein
MKSLQLVCIFASYLLSSTFSVSVAAPINTSSQDKGGAAEHPVASSSNVVPDEIRSLVNPTDTLLAYKTLDLIGDGKEDAVIIVRHPTTNSEQNPCELIVLRRLLHTFEIMDKSDSVVNCRYNNFAKYIAKNYDDLNQYLELKPFEIEYNNIKPTGHDNYTFKFSQEKRAWYVSKIDISYSQSNHKNDAIEIIKELASYPKDFGWISMSTFNPDSLRGALSRNKIIVR